MALFVVMCKCAAPKAKGHKCLEGDCQNRYGVEIFTQPYLNDDGSKKVLRYAGEFLNGKFHGYGILDKRSWNGEYYEGGFVNHKFHGYGKWDKLKSIPWPKDELESCPWKYEGFFENCKPHGNGTLTTRTGKVYKGEFAFGGICYEGNCVDGEGAILFWHGLHYKGAFKDAERNGYGEEYDANNRIKYIGGFKDGRYEGFGTYKSYELPKWINGKYREQTLNIRYDGMFVKGDMKGQGKVSRFDDFGNLIGVSEGEWDNIANCKGPKC
ncbi:Conserved hypothetical protein [Leptospira biflexa serovar Patoc strain 'Patoc 1 (Ames)']|uniref:MORN repeat protein n=1 Tax=Leptospira biflexa serovar Patoc (strain Patoc 1 / ATCC 23582 / Paris) TaxID=456481 RepID=B0SPN0_LEPBP|nr:hypothetical protein [Leptospira biflexa]ABZ95434.1 Conserved hypothetical protein [Leptospira biflexa serovar Patoc strain 'Patoc 1 (Ames)']ABZ99136.1 Hypothetical protein, MORN repeat family protein; putative signal peptide [Leptospira biflexa serovar Patoc strain 'Patoc 1 (Paris)']